MEEPIVPADPLPAPEMRVLKYESVERENLKTFRDVEEGKRMDAANAERYEENKRLVAFLNPLLQDLGLRPIRAPQPDQSYGELASRNLDQWLRDPGVRIKEAIRYLHERERLQWPEFLQDLDSLPEIADDIAYEERCEAMRARFAPSGGIPVRGGGGTGRWDGLADTDSLGRRVQWKRRHLHTFLTPGVDVAICI